nr:MAG TPA: hypothetical protein [Caudoviricetes sp.]
MRIVRFSDILWMSIEVINFTEVFLLFSSSHRTMCIL